MAQSQAIDPLQLPDKQEYKKFYNLQDNNIRQQKKVRSHFKKLIDILKDYSNKIGQWKDEWIQFDADHQSKISDYQSTWKLFNISISSIDDFTENIDRIVAKLQRTHQSIPKPEMNETLKAKIKEARVGIDALDKEIKDMEEQNQELQKQKDAFEHKSSRSFMSCISPQTSSDDLTQRQSSTTKSIESKKAKLRRKLELFDERKEELYNDSKAEEIARCEQLKQQSTAFLQAFNLTSEEFNKLSRNYNAEDDFQKWETKFLMPIINPLSRSQSNKKKVSSNENNE